jgi:hypothetical protein
MGVADSASNGCGEVFGGCMGLLLACGVVLVLLGVLTGGCK